MEKRPWQEFLDAGMLWYVNRILHVFGWSIVVVVDDDDNITEAWPSRTEWIGFDSEFNK